MSHKGLNAELHWDVFHQRNVEELKIRLAAGLDPNYRLVGWTRSERTLLEYGIIYGGMPFVKVLLEAKADVNVTMSNPRSRHKFSLLGCCRHDTVVANFLIRHGLQLRPIEEKVEPSDAWPVMDPSFYANRTAYRVLQKRKQRCLTVCCILLHRSNLVGMPLDLRRHWIIHMIWSTRFDVEWARREDTIIPSAFDYK